MPPTSRHSMKSGRLARTGYKSLVSIVGERCRKLKFFLRFHQDPSMSSSSNEYSDWIASTYHFVDRNGSVRVNVDEVVVLAVIQFTDDLVPNGRHLRVQHTYGKRDVSSFLIQQGKGEVGEESSSSSTTAW